MDPGDLDTQVTIQSNTGARDAYGQPAETWTAITGGTNVWAKIEPLSGREFLLGQSNKATTTHRITLYTLAGINPRCRVVAGSQVFNIAAVRELDDHYTQLDAMEVV